MLSLRFPAHTLACLVLVAVTLLAPAAATADRAGGRPWGAGELPPARSVTGTPPAVYPPAAPSRPLVTFPATENPNAMAVDPRAGHIFLLIPPPSDQVLHGTYPPPGPGTLATYDERSGALIRTTPVPSGSGKLLLDGARSRLYVIASTIQVVDTRTGALLRTIPFFSSAAAIDPASGHLLLATSAYAAGLPRSSGPDGALIAIDALAPPTPTVIFATRLSNNPLDALGVDPLHGRIYVADAGPVTQPGEQCVPGHCTSSVYTLDSATGRLLATTALHDPDEESTPYQEQATCLAVAPAADRVVVTETAGGRARGEVRVLDARTGALLSTSYADYSPCVLAIDQRTGLAYIAHGSNYMDYRASGGMEILDFLRGVFVDEITSPGRYPTAVLADPDAHLADVLWASLYQPPTGLPEGSLTVLNGRSGAEIRALPLTANPFAAALDLRRGGLIVLNRPALPGNTEGPLVGTSSLVRIPPPPWPRRRVPSRSTMSPPASSWIRAPIAPSSSPPACRPRQIAQPPAWWMCSIRPAASSYAPSRSGWHRARSPWMRRPGRSTCSIFCSPTFPPLRVRWMRRPGRSTCSMVASATVSHPASVSSAHRMAPRWPSPGSGPSNPPSN